MKEDNHRVFLKQMERYENENVWPRRCKASQVSSAIFIEAFIGKIPLYNDVTKCKVFILQINPLSVHILKMPLHHAENKPFLSNVKPRITEKLLSECDAVNFGIVTSFKQVP